MSKMLVRLVMLLPLVLSGCMVRSLHPIYTDKDLVPMPALEGTWKGEDEGETFSFVREGGQYRFSFVVEGTPLLATAHFAKIGKKTYMDLTLLESSFDEIEEKTRVPFAAFSTPVHMFYQVEARDKIFRMRSMNHAWAKERREKGRLWIDHIAQDDSTLLTADTVRVQRFLRLWANDDDAWDSWEEIPLVPAETPQPPKQE